MSEAAWQRGDTALSPRNVWRDAIVASAREHRFYLAYAAVYFSTVFSILVFFGFTAAHDIFDDAVATFVCHLPVVLILFLIWSARQIVLTGIDGFLPRLGRTLSRTYLSPEALGRVLPVLVSIPLIFGAFFAIKIRIPDINPFSYDMLFAKWSAWLAGGAPTWQILQVWFGAPWIIASLNFVYYLWFPVVHLTLYWQVFTRRRSALRLQFITAFMACWGLLGTFVALALSSAGPAFLGALSGKPTLYDGLLELLNQAQRSGYNVSALEVQHLLWQIYARNQDIPFAGISAMPSLHVSMAVLLALFGWKIGKLAGAAYTVFAALIFIGSVLLAFHYAIDGYVAGVLTFGIWLACGKISRHVYPSDGQPQASVR